jgi:hypothetical protein
VGFRVFTSGAVLALLSAFLQAPVAHVHEHESTQRHAGGFFHAHFGHLHVNHPAQPELKDLDPDDDAVSLQWFSGTPNTPQEFDVVLCAIPVFLPPARREWCAKTVQPNSHDPPILVHFSPGSPPV